MSRTVYVNGEFVDENEAKISIFDRGFLMADAVYEVTTVLEGKLIEQHDRPKALSQLLKVLAQEGPLIEYAAKL